MKKKSKSPKLNERKIVALVIFCIMVVAIAWLAISLEMTKRELRDVSSLKFGLLVTAAVDNLHSDLPVDPKTGDVYLPEAKLRLPASNDYLTKMKYSSYPAVDSTPASYSLASVSDIGRFSSKVLGSPDMNSMFAVVPEYQACARGYQLSFTELKADVGPELFQKKLSDGRTLYVYKEDLCSEFKTEIANYLKNIDSY